MSFTRAAAIVPLFVRGPVTERQRCRPHERRRPWQRGRRPRYSPRMIFEDVRSGGGCSYVVACGETCAGAMIDPELPQIDRTLALADRVFTGWREAGYPIEATAPQG